jgi:hypothetical protein
MSKTIKEIMSVLLGITIVVTPAVVIAGIVYFVGRMIA